MVGKKVETPNKAVAPRAAPAPQVPRAAPSAVRSEPPMDVDPAELIPTIPPAGQVAAAVNQAPVAISDSDLEEDDSETLMFKRPEPQGPPRRPPPPNAKPAAPPGKSGAKPPLPAPTRVEKTGLARAKAAERPAAPPPPKPVVKPPPPKSPENPILAAPPANETPVEPKLSERPLFEVTLGSEKPLLATPEAGEISLLAHKSANVPLLAPPQASDLGSFGLKPQKVGGVAALSMLDFSRDVAGLGQSSPPNRIGSRIVDFGRAHAKWLVMSGATVLIATVCWTVFHAAASTDTAAVEPAQGTPTLAANPAARQPATSQPVPTAQPVATEMPAAPSADPVAAAPIETAPVEKTEVAEPPAAAASPPAAAPAAAAVAVRPGAAPAEEAPAEEAPAERAERPAPVAAPEPVARAARSGVGTERPSSRSSETTELPAAKAAPEPVSAPAPAAPVAAPTVGGFDSTADFDQSAAMAALRQAAESAKRCHTPDAPSGGVRIAVTFARSGAVSATQIEGPVAGTPLGDCVTAKFQSARVPPFRGSVMTVRKTVMF